MNSSPFAYLNTYCGAGTHTSIDACIVSQKHNNPIELSVLSASSTI
ncbi:hypothetical protein M0N77_03895 [Psychrobacter sp. AH5]